MVENGEITEPDGDAVLIGYGRLSSSGTGPRRCDSSTRSDPTSRPGQERAGRTARAFRCRRVSPPCGCASSRSAEPRVTERDLLALARSVAGAARADEQIEA